ncbi:MAG: LpqN/LpqT family lipoprotein [Mycobacterium sp.]|nr:LpqN/LpqT family lipoprotein [Mycobacterium sp.]MBV9720785.1 LpqN/LpqT family lipoprotein [Mycobacterium sp.]
MVQIAHSWRVTVAALAVGVVGILGFASPTASADPGFPPGPNPVPVPAPPVMPQAVTVAPGQAGTTVPGIVAAVPGAPAPVSSALAPARPAVPPAPAAAAPPAPPAQPAVLPASSGTLRDFFNGKNVKMEAQQAQNFKALDFTLPMPPGWTQVPDPNVPDAFVVTANRRSNSLYTSNAQLVVYRLVGDFDPKEAITHGYLDSAQLPAWRSTNASMADFNGFPSSIIEGTYRQNEMMLNTSHRHVIVTSGPDKYLVSLAVTTDAAQAVAEAPGTDAIVNGFRVGPPGSNPAAAAPPAAPAAAAAAPSSPAASQQAVPHQ